MQNYTPLRPHNQGYNGVYQNCSPGLLQERRIYCRVFIVFPYGQLLFGRMLFRRIFRCSVVLSVIPLSSYMIWANTSRMMTCGLPWPMPWTTSLEIARTAIFSKFSNATESRWHFLTTILWPFDGYPLMVKKFIRSNQDRLLRTLSRENEFINRLTPSHA